MWIRSEGVSDGKLNLRLQFLQSSESAMNSYSRPLSIFLIVLPYMLLPAVVWLAVNAPEPSARKRSGPKACAGHCAQSTLAGAFLGWLAGRPHWFYPWLGFAVYGAVAALLQFALGIMSWGDSRSLFWLGVVLILSGILALFRCRDLARLAAVATTAGRLYSLSSRRTDHPPLRSCGRR